MVFLSQIGSSICERSRSTLFEMDDFVPLLPRADPSMNRKRTSRLLATLQQGNVDYDTIADPRTVQVGIVKMLIEMRTFLQAESSPLSSF